MSIFITETDLDVINSFKVFFSKQVQQDAVTFSNVYSAQTSLVSLEVGRKKPYT